MQLLVQHHVYTYHASLGPRSLLPQLHLQCRMSDNGDNNISSQNTTPLMPVGFSSCAKQEEKPELLTHTRLPR